MKRKQRSELRVSRRCIEVEREKDSFRSGWSKKCVAVSVCVVSCVNNDVAADVAYLDRSARLVVAWSI